MSSHDKELEQWLLLCIVLNVGLSKLPVVANSFVVCISLSFYFKSNDLNRLIYLGIPGLPTLTVL